MWELWNGSPPPNATAKLPVVRTATYWTIPRETGRRRAACRRARPARTGNRRTAPARRHDATFGPSGTRHSASAWSTRTCSACGSRAAGFANGSDNSGRASAGPARCACAWTRNTSARRAGRCNPNSPSDAGSGSTGPTDNSDSATNATSHARAIRARAARDCDSADRHAVRPSAPRCTGTGGTSPCTARTDRAGNCSADTARS